MNFRDLITYYNLELDFLRQAGAEFARKFPRVAQRLELQAAESPDPHVERLLEAFAFLTARLHRKLDDEQGELSQALIHALLPQYLAPVPSCCVVQFVLDAAALRASQGQAVARHTPLFSHTVSGTRCTFRTCYDVLLWPLEVAAVSLASPRPELQPPPGARAVLSLRLQLPPRLRFCDFQLSNLRFYLHGSERQAHALFDFLLNQVTWVDFRLPDATAQPLARLSASEALSPVGLEPEESLLPGGQRTASGHQLLLEYFAFPHKFLFFQLNGLDSVVPRLDGRILDVQLYAPDLPSAELGTPDVGNFRLGCTPAVNLYRRSTEPIQVTHTVHEYPVVPDRFRLNTTEVWSIERVRGSTATTRARGGWQEYAPFYATSHAQSGALGDCYWAATRRPSDREEDEGTDVFLSFVNLELEPENPGMETVVVDALCTNRDLPAMLPFGETRDRGDFQVEGLPLAVVLCLTRPTPCRRPRLGKGVHWRLVSSLLVSLQGILDPVHGTEVLSELLRLFDFSQTLATQRAIQGVVSVAGRSVMARVQGKEGEVGLARGTEVTLTLDPDAFVGSSMLLFGSVLERFLAQQVSLNTFCRLKLRVKGREGELKEWPPRAGNQPVL